MTSGILSPEWNLSPEGLNIVTQNGSVKDTKTVLKNALNSDLKVIGKPALAHELSKTRIEKIVLQIQKIRNISAPKAKEESQAAPRMLKLALTDGESYIQAIEMSPINSISREKTAPGTKVLVNGANILSGYLLINPQNCTVLGGQVEHLYEKWLLAKSIQQMQYSKVSNEGAPPWVAFGHKIITGKQDKPFKSLEKSKDGNIDSEFEQQRKDAIAEASSGAIRKTFGGRVKQNVQPAQNSQQFNRGKNNEKEYEKGRKGKFSQKDDETMEKLQRPSDKVSLFSFLEDKLPMPEPKKPVELKNQFTSAHSKQNNQYYQKDSRNQQRSEGNFSRNESKMSSKPQFENSNYTTIQKNKRPNTEQNHNSSASKQNNSEPVNITIPKNLPQRSNSPSNNANPRFNSSENSNSNSIRKNADVANNVGNYNPRNTQQSQYRNERYPQQQNASSNARNDFNQPHSQSGYYNNFKQQQRMGVTNSNYPTSGHQYPTLNNYQQPNIQYNQKPHQNFAPNPSLNAEMHHLANTLSKMSVSNEFASRSLRQHLNLGPPKRQEVQGGQGIAPNSLNVGDHCMARYWEDGKFYPATVAAITEKTYAIQFTGYGNIEEVLKHDCFSVATANSYNQLNRNQNNSYPQNNFSGTTMEFRSRRGPPRN